MKRMVQSKSIQYSCCCLLASFFLLFASPCSGEGEAKSDRLRRIYAYLLIGDSASAVQEAEAGLREKEENRDLQVAYSKALAAAGNEKKALEVFHKISQGKEKQEERDLLEEISWGILHKSTTSSQHSIRIASLIGAYLTHDVRAVKIMQAMMRDSNVLLRSVAIKLSSSYLDGPLQDDIIRMISLEKMWQVRLELIQAIGKMRMKSQLPYLEGILASDKTTFEEKTLAIQALTDISDAISLEKIEKLSKSERAGLRRLAAEAVAHFGIKEARDFIFPLIYDPRPDVRIAALHAIARVFISTQDYEEIKSLLEHALKDIDPSVAITAAWAAMLLDSVFGQKHMEKWLFDETPENRRLAAAAVAKAGSLGASLALEGMRKSKDPYVRVNLALGLMGQRVEVKRCCNMIFEFLLNEKRQCMWDEERNPLFRILSPSRASHNDAIPNFPEALDQMTRLELFSLLAIMGDGRSLIALKDFLQKKTWGITGFAAAMLLREGDEDALEVVRQLLKDPHPTIRMQAALVMAMYGKDESVVVILEEAYQTADHNQKLHILEALGHIGKAECAPFLTRALEEPFEILRIIAASSLIQCLNK